MPQPDAFRSEDAIEVLRRMTRDDSPAMTESDVMRRNLRDSALNKLEEDQITLNLAIDLLRQTCPTTDLARGKLKIVLDRAGKRA